MSDKQYCEKYGICEERFKQLNEKVNILESKTNKLKDEVDSIKLSQMQEAEKTTTLYRAFDEIKDTIKEFTLSMKALDKRMDESFEKMNEKMDKQNEKQNDKLEKVKEGSNSWKDSIINDILKLAIQGGIIFFILYSTKVIKF